MANFTLNKYQGRTLTLTVNQNGENFDWTLTSSGGSVNYYTIYECYGEINGTLIFDYRPSIGWTSYSFPAATGSRSGSVHIGGSSRNINITFNGSIYWAGGGSHGGTMWYSAPSRTATFHANGGNSTPGSITANQGSSITLPGAISRNSSTSSGTLYVYYDANGGFGAPSSQSGTYVNTTPYNFNGWALGSTSGTRYSANSSFTLNDNVDFYATWTTGTTYRSSNPSITLSSSRPSRTYYTFDYWYSGSTHYSPGSRYTFSSTTTLYAHWTANPPTSLSISRTSSTTTSISVSVSAIGLTMTNYTLYYRKKGSGSGYTSKSLGTSTTGTITGLDVDTDYEIYFTATNAGGTSTSSTVTYSTLLNTPSLSTPTYHDLFPFMVTVSASGSVTPSRTLSYCFSKDKGQSWTSYQSSGAYHWTGLDESTTYELWIRVKATHVGVNASDTTTTKTITITTPSNQARIRIKKDGQWKKGVTFIKKNGAWKKALRLYIKKDGQWVENKNFYDGEPSIWD